jgi:SAM-dependent methyltransferase
MQMNFIRSATPELPMLLPPPAGYDSSPVWTGRGFQVGPEIHAVLKYHVGASGWTDELTGFHEATGGEYHYINLASLEHAVGCLETWVTARNPVIIDIGCSSGFLLKWMRRRLPRAVILGSDFVPGALSRLASHLPDVPLIQFDLLKCPLPEQSVDAAVLLNVLEHIEDDASALRQVYRILKPGGIVVLEVPAGPHLYDIYDKQLMHWRRYTMKGLLHLARAAGFDILERSHLGFLVYPAFWAVKKWNQRYLAKTDAEQRSIVAMDIRRYANNPLMNAVMRIEANIRRFLYYPCGIRCLLVGRRRDAVGSPLPAP